MRVIEGVVWRGKAVGKKLDESFEYESFKGKNSHPIRGNYEMCSLKRKRMISGGETTLYFLIPVDTCSGFIQNSFTAYYYP